MISNLFSPDMKFWIHINVLPKPASDLAFRDKKELSLAHFSYLKFCFKAFFRYILLNPEKGDKRIKIERNE
jgi:hypothetical protein